LALQRGELINLLFRVQSINLHFNFITYAVMRVARAQSITAATRTPSYSENAEPGKRLAFPLWYASGGFYENPPLNAPPGRASFFTPRIELCNLTRNDPSKLTCLSSLGMASVVIQLRPSSEHIPIVRAPGAWDHPGAIPARSIVRGLRARTPTGCTHPFRLIDSSHSDP
jgi:hypothetical protein